MQKRVTVLAVLGFALFVGYMIYSSMTLSQVSCDVCIEFHGRTECRKAGGANKEEAQRTATDVACAVMTSSMAEGIACGNTRPSRIACEGK